jgi:uncharacterized protein
MNRLDPRLPLVFDIKDLGRRPGAMVKRTLTVEAPEDLGTEVIAIPAGQPIELDLRLESVLEGILVSGTVSGTATGACVRCLEPVTTPVTGHIQDLFVYADRAEHAHDVGADDDEDEVREIVGDLIDLEPALRDAVVPALPFQPVCREDCPGLCSECGAHLAQDPTHHHEVIDPRWAALQGIAEPPSGNEEKRN